MTEEELLHELQQLHGKQNTASGGADGDGM
jgi:hypothetical protein